MLSLLFLIFHNYADPVIFFFQEEDGIRDGTVTGVQTCDLPISGGKGPCTDEWLAARKRQFERFRHPFVIVPGDNEWVDCHRTGFDPMERLKKFRELFESGESSLGGLRLERQSGRYEEYREHMRWIAGEVLFVGVNVQGSNNNLGRTPAMDAEHRSRMAAVFAWLEDSVQLAEKRRLAGML